MVPDLADEVLKAVFKDLSLGVTGHAFASLHTSDPNQIGDNEVSNSNGYDRQQVVFLTPTQGDPTTISLDENIVFPEATGSWGTVTHLGLWDDNVYGNGTFLWQLDLTTDYSSSLRTIDSGDKMTIFDFTLRFG